MRTQSMLLIIALVAALAPRPVLAKSSPSPTHRTVGVSCGLPESDAEALVILNNYYTSGNYSWDHANLTVAVQAHPNATAQSVAEIHGAIATWSSVIADCFDGLITLTDVTGTQPSEQKAADIVIHYTPNALGAAYGGIAHCGDHECPNVIVRSEYPFGRWGEEWSSVPPGYLGLTTLHELGHALGVGHATNLWESMDLMGYGWIDSAFLGGDEPILSDCDVDALAFVFAWALEGSEPYPPAEGPYNCSLD